jgi:membrane protease YdiL (CAAX protease family)
MEASTRMSARPAPRAAHVLLAFVLALPAAMLFAAVAAPWVQAALAPVEAFPLHRVFTRLTMLGVILLMAWLIRRHGLADRSTLGFDAPRPVFLRRLLAGLVAGLVLMLLAVAALFLLDLREWNARAPQDAAGWMLLAAKGLGSGAAVALIEETFFRGALQGALQRAGALRMALFVVPVYYAAVHFLGRATSVPFEQVDALSGFVALAGFFDGFAHPLRIADAFLALWLTGVLLALVRWRTGDIAGCIGLHAGFVTVIAVVRRSSSAGDGGALGFLTSSFDGLLGLLVAAMAALACLWAWRRLRPS